MKKGPNRQILDTGYSRWEFEPRALGKVGRTDFSVHLEAQHDILNQWAIYQSKLSADELAPTGPDLQGSFERLSNSSKYCAQEIRSFLYLDSPDEPNGGRMKLEFRAAMTSLLSTQNQNFTEMRQALEDALRDLERVAAFAEIVTTELSLRLSAGEDLTAPRAALRNEFFVRLHRVLVAHDLDAKCGENSLIVLLVLHLEGRDEIVTKAGAEAADLDRNRRKSLARDVKAAIEAAVKEEKGG